MNRFYQSCCVLLLLLCAVVKTKGQVTVAPARPVMTPYTFGRTASGGSFSPSLSADGRFVAFASYAKDLLPAQQNNLFCDIFLRDVASNATYLVSVNSSGNGGGNGNSSQPIISTNGQFVAFLSMATNLAAGVTVASTNFGPNLYYRDLQTGVTTVESIGMDGKIGAGYCSEFNMTPDGRYLLFISTQTNLTTNVTTAVPNIYVRDHVLGATELVTVRATNSTYGAAGGGDSPAICDDGHLVVFHSMSTDLGGAADNVFLRDRLAQTTTCIGTNARAFDSSLSRTFSASISGNGSAIAFSAAASSYSRGMYFDVVAGTTTLLTNVTAGSLTDLSADGHRALYHITNSYLWSAPDVLVWDAVSNTVLVVDSDTRQNGRSSMNALISSDGQRAAFISNVTNASLGATGDVELFVRDLDAGVTRVVTVNTNGQPIGGSLIADPVFSADGHYLAFACDNDSLVADDHNHASDIFLWSCDTGELKLISQRTPLRAPATDVGSCVSGAFCISSNGQILVVNSVDGFVLDSNRIPDTNRWLDIYEFATDSGQRALVSADFGGPLATNGSAGTPVLSADGRQLAYLRNAGGSNLDIGNVYWRSLKGYTENLISTNSAGVPIGNASALSISPDGRYVAYQTISGVSSNDNNTLVDVYAYDTLSNQTIWVSSSVTAYGATNCGFTSDSQWIVFQTRDSKAAGIDLQTTGPQLYARSLVSNVIQPITHSTTPSPDTYTNSAPAFSANGAVVAYVAVSGQTNIFVNGFNNTVPTLACTNCTSPSLNSDGSKIAYVARQGGRDQIFVTTLDSLRTDLVSVALDQVSGASTNCFNPILSRDGRFVIFSSAATNLVAGDTNGRVDVFVRDLVLSNTVALGANGGHTPNFGAVNPVLSGDGRTIVFQSFSTDLAPNVVVPARSLYLVRLGSGDSDHDGMDDDWEMTYFGDLSHDGTGDTDGDGMTDLQELLAGTNPVDGFSAVRCLAVTASAGGATVYWSSVPGHSYRVEFKSSLNDSAWTTLVDSTTTATTTAFVTDADASLDGQRFYRVVALP